MKAKGIDFAKLSEAVEKFGSLQKANAQLEKENAWLRQENQNLAANRDKLAAQVADIKARYNYYQVQLNFLLNEFNIHSNQYELFCSFMAMVMESPSVTESIDTIIALFQRFKKPGWYVPKSIDELRSSFVHTVMGDYLKCFRCKSCNAQFIINKEPQYKYSSNYYQCPSCHTSYMVYPDDSFLKALVSEEQMENTKHLREVQEEIEILKPFKAFLSVPCEICHEPIKEWDDYNVKLAIQGIGFGHTACWRSDLGRMKEFARALAKLREEAK